MAEVAMALLCDHATVREGLLHILGGGVTRLWREKLPAPLGSTLVLQIKMTQDEDAIPHEVRAEIWDRNNKSIAQVAGAVQYQGGAKFEKGEFHMLPLVLPLGVVGIEKYGRHEIRIDVDGGPVTSLQFWALHPDEKKLPPLNLDS